MHRILGIAVLFRPRLRKNISISYLRVSLSISLSPYIQKSQGTVLQRHNQTYKEREPRLLSFLECCGRGSTWPRLFVGADSVPGMNLEYCRACAVGV